MSFLVKNLKPKKILEIYRAAGALQTRQGHFYPDFKPGKVPKTEEERIKAAEKYNLLPEEYEHYDENEGYGDYPKLPYESVDSKDPWYPWDIPEYMRNYNEPVHVNIVSLIPECVSTAEQNPPIYKQLYYFLSITAVASAFTYFLSMFHTVVPQAEKQFVTPGVTHYTFEPDLGKRH